MYRRMCMALTLCLVFLLGVSEGFFMPASLRKQAPQTTYNSQPWLPTPITAIGANSPVNTNQPGYDNPKEYNPYQQQQPQSLHQTQQQQQQQQQLQPQQQQIHQPQTFSSPLYTGPKYEPTPFQSVNQPLYVYDGVYSPGNVNPYSQSVQLVPCLCPVNKEVLEQQNQQLQQQTITPTSAETNNASSPPLQPNQKKST